MKLTRRQEEFVQKMVELKQEFDGPVHYSLLAERLGVSPFTAYDMLCLLEEKGYVTSEYQLPTDKSGPGRAERVFYPRENGPSPRTAYRGRNRRGAPGRRGAQAVCAGEAAPGRDAGG